MGRFAAPRRSCVILLYREDCLRASLSRLFTTFIVQDALFMLRNSFAINHDECTLLIVRTSPKMKIEFPPLRVSGEFFSQRTNFIGIICEKYVRLIGKMFEHIFSSQLQTPSYYFLIRHKNHPLYFTKAYISSCIICVIWKL